MCSSSIGKDGNQIAVVLGKKHKDSRLHEQGIGKWGRRSE